MNYHKTNTYALLVHRIKNKTFICTPEDPTVPFFGLDSPRKTTVLTSNPTDLWVFLGFFAVFFGCATAFESSRAGAEPEPQQRLNTLSYKRTPPQISFYCHLNPLLKER